MSTTDKDRLIQALDGAELVAFSADGTMMAVWHGGHTVNLYGVHGYGYEDGVTISAMDCTEGAGDLETGKVTREDAEDAAESLIEYHTEIRAE